MDQKAFLAVSAMMNAFPQGNGNPDLTMSTYVAALRNVTSQAVIEAAQRFTCGEVAGQNKTFAPSIAEFVTEARRIHDLMPFRGRPALPSPDKPAYRQPDPDERERMSFKVAVLQASNYHSNGPNRLAAANAAGLENLVALGQEWGIAVPDAIWRKLERAA